MATCLKSLKPPFITPRARYLSYELKAVEFFAGLDAGLKWYDTTPAGCVGHYAELQGLGDAVCLDRADQFLGRLEAAEGGKLRAGWAAAMAAYNSLDAQGRALTLYEREQIWQAFSAHCPDRLLFNIFRGQEHPRRRGPYRWQPCREPDSAGIDAFAAWYKPRRRRWSPDIHEKSDGVHIFNLHKWPCYDIYPEHEGMSERELEALMAEYLRAAKKVIDNRAQKAILYIDCASLLLSDALDNDFVVLDGVGRQTTRRGLILARR